MLRLSKLILQWALLPPINFNFYFPPRRPKPPREVDVTERPKGFDPRRRIDNHGARMFAASNALEPKDRI